MQGFPYMLQYRKDIQRFPQGNACLELPTYVSFNCSLIPSFLSDRTVILEITVFIKTTVSEVTISNV